MVNDNDARFRSHVFLVSVGSNHAAWAARSWASCCRKAQELDAVMHDQLSRTTLLGYLDKTRVPRTLPWLLRLLVYAVAAPYCRVDEAELLWTAIAQTVDEWWLPRHRGRAFLVGACFSSFEVHTDPEYQLPEVEQAPIQGLAPEREFGEGLTPSALTLRASAVAASWLLMFAIHADGSWLSEAGRLVSSFEDGEPVPFATAKAAAEELLTLLDKPRATPDDARAAHRDAPQVSARACRILAAGRGGRFRGVVGAGCRRAEATDTPPKWHGESHGARLLSLSFAPPRHPCSRMAQQTLPEAPDEVAKLTQRMWPLAITAPLASDADAAAATA